MNTKNALFQQFLILIGLVLGTACTESSNSTETTKPTIQSSVTTTPKATPMEEPKPTEQAHLVPNGQPFSVDYLKGKFDPATHKDFVKLSTKHASDKNMYLRKDTYEAFIKMYDAAEKDGLKLVIRSATRPFEHQKRIWEGKWTGSRLVEGKNLSKTIKDPIQRALKILEFSSMPSTSRHHWGTDFDINAFENSYFEKGEGKKIYDWMVKHAASFGFCQPYTAKGDKRPFGYFEEKWHWSYTPVSKNLTQQAEKKLKDTSIEGFKGAETASDIGVVRKYILGISEDCF